MGQWKVRVKNIELQNGTKWPIFADHWMIKESDKILIHKTSLTDEENQMKIINSIPIGDYFVLNLFNSGSFNYSSGSSI